MFKKFYKRNTKMKIIIFLNMVFIWYLAMDNYNFDRLNEISISMLFRNVFHSNVLMGIYLPFLILFYINAIYKEVSFNKLIIFKVKSRETWLVENLKFISKISLFAISSFICGMIIQIALNISKYDKIILTLQEMGLLAKNLVFLYLYFLALSLIFFGCVLIVKKINIALVLMFLIILVDLMFMRKVNRFTRFLLLQNVINTSNVMFSLFYWVLIISGIIFIINSLKDKVDLA